MKSKSLTTIVSVILLVLVGWGIGLSIRGVRNLTTSASENKDLNSSVPRSLTQVIDDRPFSWNALSSSMTLMQINASKLNPTRPVFICVILNENKDPVSISLIYDEHYVQFFKKGDKVQYYADREGTLKAEDITDPKEIELVNSVFTAAVQMNRNVPGVKDQYNETTLTPYQMNGVRAATNRMLANGRESISSWNPKWIVATEAQK